MYDELLETTNISITVFVEFCSFNGWFMTVYSIDDECEYAFCIKIQMFPFKIEDDSGEIVKTKCWGSTNSRKKLKCPNILCTEKLSLVWS